MTIKKIASFDVDSVLLDTEEVIFKYIEKNYGKRVGPTDVTHWTYYMENFPSVLQYFGNPELYERVEPIYDMIGVMEEVIKMCGPEGIQLVTSSHEGIRQAKEDALERFYGHIPGWDRVEIIHVGLTDGGNGDPHHKHEYTENTLMIDDAVHNVEDHLGYNHYNQALLVDFGYGWNQGYDDNRAQRVTSPAQILDAIKEFMR